MATEIELLTLIAKRLDPSLWNLFLQILGFTFIVISLAISIQAYIVSTLANQAAKDSNQLALPALCLPNNSVCNDSLSYFLTSPYTVYTLINNWSPFHATLVS